MKGAKSKKHNFQILIHNMDEATYKAVKELSENEKRSIGKQAEYMLRQFVINTTPEKLFIQPLKPTNLNNA